MNQFVRPSSPLASGVLVIREILCEFFLPDTQLLWYLNGLLMGTATWDGMGWGL